MGQRNNKKREEKAPEKKSGKFWYVAVVAILVLAIFGIYKLVAGSSGEANDPLTLTEDERMSGPDTAKVTIIEYSDFQCPACAVFSAEVKKLREEFPNDVRVVFRHYPLKQLHPQAERPSKAAEAAHRQGKFWEMHYKIYENQQTWSQMNNMEVEFEKYAKELELNIDDYRAAYEDKSIQDKLDADRKSGYKLTIDATPTFYINGKKLENNPRSYAEFKELIEQTIQDKS
ncbi:DsbA family protein [Patescibacteria group bacterium]|nr:DsbA family protein [Patescibacteria group bacterium]